MYELKICRGVLCHGNEELCKIWREIDLPFKNWHEEFDKFWPEQPKVPKICTLMGYFWAKYIMFELKNYRGVMLDDTEEYSEFEEKLTCGLENDMRNLTNLYQSTQKSRNWYFDGIL